MLRQTRKSGKFKTRNFRDDKIERDDLGQLIEKKMHIFHAAYRMSPTEYSTCYTIQKLSFLTVQCHQMSFNIFPVSLISIYVMKCD